MFCLDYVFIIIHTTFIVHFLSVVYTAIFVSIISMMHMNNVMLVAEILSTSVECYSYNIP